MRELALFAGAGGGLLGSHLLGWDTVCAVEIDPYCRRVLLQRQADGCLPVFPIWDDVKTFDGRPWRDHVDIVTGGFPCQDISAAGKGAGLAGDRSGLWFEMLRVIGEVRPAYVLAENSPHLRTRGLGTVIKGLAGLGYDCRWGVLGARHVGAKHRRDRMWIVAHHHHHRERVLSEHGEVGRPQEDVGGAFPIRSTPHANWSNLRILQGRGSGTCWPQASKSGQPRQAGWSGPPPLTGVDDGMAHRVDRTRATGNGQVPAVVAAVWRLLAP